MHYADWMSAVQFKQPRHLNGMLFFSVCAPNCRKLLLNSSVKIEPTYFMIFDTHIPKSGTSTRQGTGVKFYLTSHVWQCLGKYLWCYPHNFLAVWSRDTQMARSGPVCGPGRKVETTKTIIAQISQAFKKILQNFLQLYRS